MQLSGGEKSARRSKGKAKGGESDVKVNGEDAVREGETRRGGEAPREKRLKDIKAGPLERKKRSLGPAKGKNKPEK